jgi:HD-GYP domain-containing protein (c-di-GMP phosphodiesterase class II)
VAVADAYAAITKDRPYRNRRSRAVAMHEIHSSVGSRFDPSVAGSFLVVFDLVGGT